MRRSFAAVAFAVGLWLSVPLPARTHSVLQSPSDASDATSKLQVSKQDEIVTYNTKTGKYHCVTCSAAKRCTRNCVGSPGLANLRRSEKRCLLRSTFTTATSPVTRGLQLEELRVAPGLHEQFLVGSGCLELSFGQHQNAIGHPHAGEAV